VGEWVGNAIMPAENKQAFMARLHAILVNYTADHVAFLSRRT
jgi:hypothetical protein